MTEDVTIVRGALGGGFITMAGAFFGDVIAQMFAWQVAMAVVIGADLVLGLFKATRCGEEIRPSRAIRNTMWKMVAYFAFTLLLAVIDQAMMANGYAYHLTQWGCLAVIATEVGSMVKNYASAMGKEIDVVRAVAIVIGRVSGVPTEEVLRVFGGKR